MVSTAKAASASSIDKKLIVSLVGKAVAIFSHASAHDTSNVMMMRKDRQSWQLHHRCDPCTNEERVYVAVKRKKGISNGVAASQQNSNSSQSTAPSHHLCEIQAFSSRRANDKGETYSSFLLKSSCSTQVIGNDNKLYTITPVDPLFFLLASQQVQDNSLSTGDEKKSGDRPKQQWQPLDQILGLADDTLQSFLDSTQIRHLHDTLYLSPDECFYKFSQDRALSWLSKKQRALQQQCLVLLEKQQEQRRHSKTGTTNKGSAFAAGFRMAPDRDDEADNAEHTPSSSASSLPPARNDKDKEKQVTQAKEQSVQIICSYLNEQWRRVFLQHIRTSQQVLETAQQRATKRLASQVSSSSSASSSSVQPKECQSSSTATMATTEAATTGNTGGGGGNKKPKTNPISAGAQRLKKVNTKGMKKMSAFFKVKK